MFDDRGQTNLDTEPLVLRAEDLAEERLGTSPSMWRRLEASLVYDSRQQLPVAGVRGVAGGLPRLMYTARGIEIDFQVRPSATAGRIRLLGQVLNEEFEPGSGWVVVDGAGGSVKANLDGCGQFSIDGLAAGRQRIEVHLHHALIVIPSVHV